MSAPRINGQSIEPCVLSSSAILVCNASHHEPHNIRTMLFTHRLLPGPNPRHQIRPSTLVGTYILPKGAIIEGILEVHYIFQLRVCSSSARANVGTHTAERAEALRRPRWLFLIACQVASTDWVLAGCGKRRGTERGPRFEVPRVVRRSATPSFLPRQTPIRTR